MKTILTPSLAVVALVAVMSQTQAQGAPADSDGDGVPDIAEPLLHTDPMNADTDGDGQNDLADAEPVIAPDPIKAGGKAAPYRIGELLVENNIDPVAKRDAPDHLEIQLINEGSTALAGYTVYYTLTDVDSGAHEAYILHPDVTVPAGGQARIHVDDGTQPGHLRANPNSIYVTSKAAKHVTVTVQADGFAAVKAQLDKDAGGAEAAD